MSDTTSDKTKKQVEKESAKLLSSCVSTYTLGEKTSAFRFVEAGFKAIEFLAHYCTHLSGTVENGWAHIKSSMLKSIRICPDKSIFLRATCVVRDLFPKNALSRIIADTFPAFSYEGIKSLLKFVSATETSRGYETVLKDEIDGVKIDYASLRGTVADWTSGKIDKDGLDKSIAILLGKEPKPDKKNGKNGSSPAATTGTTNPPTATTGTTGTTGTTNPPGLTGATAGTTNPPAATTGTTNPPAATTGTTNPPAGQNTGASLQTTTAPVSSASTGKNKPPQIAALDAIDSLLLSLDTSEAARVFGEKLGATALKNRLTGAILEGLVKTLSVHGETGWLNVALTALLKKYAKPTDNASAPNGNAKPETHPAGAVKTRGKKPAAK